MINVKRQGVLFLAVLMGAILIFFYSQRLFAQDETAQLGRTALDTIVVTADRISESKREVTSNITIIDRSAIDSVPSDDVGVILGKLGLTVREYPSTLTNLIVRGFRTEAHGNDLMGGVLVLLNGRRYGSSNLGKIFSANVERIEIIRGPAAVQYGSAAMGGVINVITREGQGPLTGSVEAGIGSFGYNKYKLALSGSVSSFDYSLGYIFAKRDDFQTAKGQIYHDTRYKSKQNLNADLGFSFLENLHRIGLNFNYYHADDAWSPSYFYQQGTGAGSITDKWNESLDFTYRGATADNHFSWNARFVKGKDVDKLGYKPGINTAFTTNNVIRSTVIQAQLTHEMSFYRISAGVDYVKYDRTSMAAPRESSFEDTAGYLLAKLRFLNDSLIVSLGARYDSYKVNLLEAAGRKEGTQKHTSPSVGLAYSPVEWLKLRVNWAQAFLVPDARQLAGDYSSGSYHTVGNPDLKPETSSTWEIGFDAANPYMSGSFTYFETYSKNKIVTVDIGPGERTYINLDKAVRKGLELEGTMDIGAYMDYEFSLRPYFSVTRMFQYKDKKTDKNLDYVPKWAISVGVNFDYPKYGLKSNINMAFTGVQNIQSYPTATSTGIPDLLGGVTIVDLSITKTLMDFGDVGDVDLKVDIGNVFNKYYESVQNYPNPGRTLYVALAYSF
ncbi:MAG: TonB-dependent receptor [Deltaproteobacteria bacterium]|jgi:vitamin B12 transporter|nr:TonB-dependent receptor [Deltaproteobacteria bacterium]